MVVLNPEVGPDRPNFKSYFVLDRNFAVATPVKDRFVPVKKGATAKNTDFTLHGDNRFMRPSWVRAHGLIFGKVNIVWVCAHAYRPLSSPRRRIRENRRPDFCSNFLVKVLVKILIGTI